MNNNIVSITFVLTDIPNQIIKRPVISSTTIEIKVTLVATFFSNVISLLF